MVNFRTSRAFLQESGNPVNHPQYIYREAQNIALMHTVNHRNSYTLAGKVNNGNFFTQSETMAHFCATVHEETLNVVQGSLPVQVSYGDDLAADVVVESVDAVCVDEAVADPASSLHRLLDVTQHLPASPATISRSVHTTDFQFKLRSYIPLDTKLVISEAYFPGNLLASY